MKIGKRLPSWAGRAGRWAGAGALVFSLLSGCNVFSPLASDGAKDLNYYGLLYKGDEAINDRKYASAEDYYLRAIAINVRGSEARLKHAKAIINLYGIDYNSLNKEFEDKRGQETGIPFVDDSTTLEGIDSIYYPVATAVNDLEHILRKAKETISLGGGFYMLPDGDTADDGRVSEGVARLDLGLLQAVKAMLAPLDLDSNHRIDRACGRAICPELDAACIGTDAYLDKCREGPGAEINRFESFKKLTKNINLDNLDSKDVNARDVSTNPNDINGFLNAMQGAVAGSNYNLDSVTSAMNSHNEEKLSGQLSGIVGNMNDLNNFLSYMRYNDGLDNDLDSRSGLGGDSALVWHDFDKDGGIRFDYNDTALYPGFPSEYLNIGHPVHRDLHPDYYQTFAEWNANQPIILADTSKNSRKSLMIEHCQEMAAALPFVDGRIRLASIAARCTTLTTLLKPGTRRRDRSSDWVSGTPGVDEEMVDERDNDYDGLKDEDARNTRGMDDDDDALLNVSMVSRPDTIKPMQWADVPGSVNSCPDIAKGSMPAPPYQRQFCIGSLEHRIHLARVNGAGSDDPAQRRAALDTLAKYYSAFVVTENAPHPNCLEDFEKLDPAYRAAENLQVDDAVVYAACRFKHIWIAPMPPQSEWTSGVLGIDEEVLDRMDNDGDGWIDEDLK